MSIHLAVKSFSNLLPQYSLASCYKIIPLTEDWILNHQIMCINSSCVSSK